MDVGVTSFIHAYRGVIQAGATECNISLGASNGTNAAGNFPPDSNTGNSINRGTARGMDFHESLSGGLCTLASLAD